MASWFWVGSEGPGAGGFRADSTGGRQFSRRRCRFERLDRFFGQILRRRVDSLRPAVDSGVWTGLLGRSYGVVSIIYARP